MARGKRKKGHAESIPTLEGRSEADAGSVMHGITAEEWVRRKAWAKKQLAEWVKKRERTRLVPASERTSD